jgi:signal transduction histidine kinase/CheY-like chemotaxis protein
MLDPKTTDALRTRLAAESLLLQKQRELTRANDQIAERAMLLTNEVVERREEAHHAKSEAAKIKNQHQHAISNLRKAKAETVIAERRLWASLETIRDGFAVFGRDQTIVAANAAFFQPFADMDCVKLGISYTELITIAAEEGLINPGTHSPGAWIDWMKSRWDQATIPTATVRFWNNQFVRLDERRAPDGDIVMLAANITRQIRRQKVLENARKRAEGASRAKSAFLANMSHEIRTPMNGVLAMTDLLAEGDLTEDQRNCLETIKNSGEALLVIINDVLDYSKIEAQKLSIDYQVFDLEATINDVITLLQPSAREKSLGLMVDYDMFLPTKFNGDKGRVRQILMNLVGNAVKFTPEGHVLVRVVGLPDARPDHVRLHITVEDTGIGIPPEMRAHIFGEFNQVQSEMTREFDGTGLGLAISQRLVALMDGEIWVDGGADGGTVFGFRLTLKREGPATEFIRGQFGHRRVFLCDPDPVSRDIMNKQLLGIGLRPKLFASPEDAAGEIGADDLVISSEDLGLQGAVRLVLGHGDDAAAQVIHRPIVRVSLLNAIADVLEGAGPQEADAPPPVVAETAPGAESPVSEMPIAPVPVPVPVPEPDAPPSPMPSVATPQPLETLPAPIAPPHAIPTDAPHVTAPPDDLPEPSTPPSNVLELAAAQKIDPLAEAPPEPPHVDLRKVRVLAAEDNKTNRLVLSRLMKSLDIELVIVEDGQQAVEHFKNAPPDIFFTDISMPVMDGKTAAREIRAFEQSGDSAKVPIVAMTAHAGSGDESEILAAGIDFYMTKPLRKADLVEHILAAAPEGTHPPVAGDTA